MSSQPAPCLECGKGRLPSQFDVYTVMETESPNVVRVLGEYLNDPQRAHQHAKNVGAVVVVRSYVVVGDYRTQPAPKRDDGPHNEGGRYVCRSARCSYAFLYYPGNPAPWVGPYYPDDRPSPCHPMTWEELEEHYGDCSRNLVRKGPVK